jgi:hypothetical protein
VPAGRGTGPAVTAIGPRPVQGRPVNEFLPNGGVSIVGLGAGETGNLGRSFSNVPLCQERKSMLPKSINRWPPFGHYPKAFLKVPKSLFSVSNGGKRGPKRKE